MPQLRGYYAGERRDLLRVLMNSTSPAEANLALTLLTDSVPEKVLVSACNVREVLRSMPRAPFHASVGATRIAEATSFASGVGVLRSDLAPGVSFNVVMAGTAVLDLYFTAAGKRVYWRPPVGDEDFCSTDALDLIVSVDRTLDDLIRFIAATGVPFAPKFYLSLDDWKLDYAADAIKSLGDLF